MAPRLVVTAVALAEQQQVHGHLAERDRALHSLDGAPGIGRVQRGDAEQREREHPALAPYGQIAILVVQALEDADVATQEQLAEIE